MRSWWKLPTRLQRSAILIASGLLLSWATVSYAAPHVQRNDKGAVVAISGLYVEEDAVFICNKQSFEGVVTELRLDKAHREPKGIAIKSPKSETEYMIIFIEPTTKKPLREEISQGIRILAKLGRRVSGQRYLCGPSSVFFDLDELK